MTAPAIEELLIRDATGRQIYTVDLVADAGREGSPRPTSSTRRTPLRRPGEGPSNGPSRGDLGVFLVVPRLKLDF